MLRRGSRLLPAVLLALSTPLMAEDCPPGTEHTRACADLTAAGALAAAAAARLAAMEAADPRTRRSYEVLDRYLDYFPSADADDVGLDFNRHVLLEPEGDALVARFDQLSLRGPAFKAAFGPARIEMHWLDDDRVEFRHAMSDTIPMVHEASVVATLRLGSQHWKGVWDTRIDSLESTDLRITDLNLGGEEFGEIHIDVLSGTQRTEVDAAGDWHQISSFALAGFSVLDPLPVHIAALNVQGSITGRDFPALLEFARYANTGLREELASLDPASPEGQLAVLEKVASVYELFSGFDARMVLSDLVVGHPDEPMARVASISVDGDFVEQDGDGSSFGYSVAVDGIEADAAGLASELVPRSARLQIRLSNLPPKLMSRLLEIPMATATLEDEDMAEAMAGAALMNMFADSAVRLQILESGVRAEAARLELDLDVRANPDAALGAEGHFLARLVGLSTLLEALGPLAQDEGVAQGVAMLMMFSNRTEENGMTVDTYDIRIGADGAVTLNGKDMTALFGEFAPMPME